MHLFPEWLSPTTQAQAGRLEKVSEGSVYWQGGLFLNLFDPFSMAGHERESVLLKVVGNILRWQE